MITLRCPGCGETYYADESARGRYIKCTAKGCNTLIEVKESKAAPPPRSLRSKTGKPFKANSRAAWIGLLKAPFQRANFTRKNIKRTVTWTALVIACAALIKPAGAIAPMLLAAVMGWRYAQSKTGVWFPTVADILRAVTCGLAAAVVLIFVINDYEQHAPTTYPTTFQNIGDGLIGLIIMVNALIDMSNIYVFAAMVGVYVVLHRFAPDWNPVRNLVAVRTRLATLSLILIGITSFTVFGQDRIDSLTSKAEQQLTERHKEARDQERTYKHKQLLAQSILANLNQSNGVDVKDKRYFQELFGNLGGQPAMVRTLRMNVALKAADTDSGRALTEAKINAASVTPDPIEPPVAWTISKWFNERDTTTRQEANVEALKNDTSRFETGAVALLSGGADINPIESKSIVMAYLDQVINKYAEIIPDNITPDQLQALTHLTGMPMIVNDMRIKALEARLAAARGLMKAGQWRDAIDQLTALNVEYPDLQVGRDAADLVPECHFRMAEQDFADKDYDSAAEEFDAVASKYPNSPRVPEARRRGISSEVMVIKAGKHENLGPASLLGPSGMPGSSVVEIYNQTGYHLTVLYDGPDPQIALLDPGAHGSLSLKSGSYTVATSVDLMGVTPKWGVREFHDVHAREVFETK